MRWLLRAGGVVAALFALVLIGLAVALPRIAGSPVVRTRIESAARDAVGRDVRFERLEAGLWPPALRVVAPRVAGASEKSPPLLEARSVSLELSLLPLLTGTVAIDSLAVDGATLRLVRTAKGIELPERPARGAADAQAGGEAKAGGAAEAGSEADGAGAIDLAVRQLSLRDSTLVLEDRSVRPKVTWELRDLRADASGRLLDERVDLEASAAFASGGKIALEGEASLAGEGELEAELSQVDLAPLAPYLKASGVEALSGVADGSLRVSGRAADPEHAGAVLDFERFELRRGPLRLAGPLRLEADLASPRSAPQGSFRADAVGAELAWGESFHKPAGVPAEITGRLASSGGALAVEDLVVALRDMTLRGRAASLSPLALELRSESFELAGLGELMPGLAKAAPSGRAKIETLAYTAKPQALKGRVLLDGATLQPAGRPPLTLRGAVVAQGESLRLEDGRLLTGGQELGVDASLEDLFGAPRYRMALEASQADANQVVSAFANKPDTLYGLLGLQASFDGPLGGDLLNSLQGRAGFGVDDGRLVGVSLLRSAFDRLGEAGTLALDLGRAFGGRDLQRFYGDAFETLRGTFDVQGGLARTDDLTFVYRGYSALLRGTLALADLSLDTEGEITFDEELDALIAKQLGIENHTPARRTLSLAAVKGTLSQPKVRLSSRSLADLASAYATPLYADPLRRQAEKALGKDGGAVVDQGLEILDGLLGGGRRKRADDRAPAPAEEPAPAPEAQATPSPEASPGPASETAPEAVQ